MQQQQNQDNLNMAYEDFKNQRDYPLQQLNVTQAALQGMQIPSGSSTVNTKPSAMYSASPLQSAIGTGMSTYALMRGQ